MSLALDEPARGLVRDVVLAENAPTQERALRDQVVVAPVQLGIRDRNFRVRTVWFRILRGDAFVVVRRHDSALSFAPRRCSGRSDARTLVPRFEPPVAVDDPAGEGRRSRPRRIVVRLDQPTRNGATALVRTPNRPESVPADRRGQVDRGRWAREGHCPPVTDVLQGEIPSWGSPRASLFAFWMSVVAGKALAVVKGNRRAVHGDELVAEVSNDAWINEVAAVDPGLMIAVPPPQWSFVRGGAVGQVAELVNDVAAHAPVERRLRSRRGPQRPRKAKSSGSRIHHVATKKLLDKARGVPPPRRRSQSGARQEVREKLHLHVHRGRWARPTRLSWWAGPTQPCVGG